MKDVLETIIKSLASNKEEISINQIDGEQSIIFEVRVADDDMGKVIGKQGAIAKSIRTIMKALAAREGKRVSIEFLD